MNPALFQRISPVKPLILLLFLCFSTKVNARDGIVVGIRAVASGYSLLETNAPVYAPELAIGAGLKHDQYVRLFAGTGATSLSYDTPSVQGTLPISIWWIGAEYDHPLLRIGEATSVFGSVGLGITSLGRDALEIPLGVAGTTLLPAVRETRGHLSAGASLARYLGAGFSAVAGSTIRFLTPVSRGEVVYSLYGGINIELP